MKVKTIVNEWPWVRILLQFSVVYKHSLSLEAAAGFASAQRWEMTIFSPEGVWQAPVNK